jgi:murein DD-endopeptidase MepM/ murein hydrolase activator NlpD
VDAVNREMEEMERGFDERPSGDGTVHVQSHTRDGGKVEVADYWRAAPGQGGGDAASDRSGADDKDDESGDDYPPGESPVDNPRIRGQDGYGEGDYGDDRGKDEHGNPKFHKGVDLVTEPGETVRSPVAGTVLPPFDPYRSDPERRGKLSAVQIKTDDGHIVEILYVDPRSSGLKPGDRVEIGTPVGKAQDLSPAYPPRKSGVMTNHIDVRIRKDGIYKNPKPVIFGRGR